MTSGRFRFRRIGLAVALVAALTPWAAQAKSRGQQALDRGTRHYKAGRFGEAAQAFREAARLDPGLLLAWENLGWALHRGGRHPEAVETWGTVLKVEPQRVRLWNEIAAIRISEGRWDDAMEALRRSLALDGKQPLMRLRLAGAFEKAGRLDEAEAQHREVVALEPASLEPTLRLAEFYLRTGREDAAIALYEEARGRLAPFAHVLGLRVARLHARRGDVAFGSGDFGSAVASYEKAVRSDPRHAQYLVNLGWAQRSQGDLARAVESWRRALELDPDRGSLYRHIADAALERQDLQEAGALYGRAWAKAERTPSVAYHLTEIALEEGRPEEALQWLRELFGLPDADSEWSRRVAGLFARHERPSDGIEFLKGRLRASRAPGATRGALSYLHAVRGSAAYAAEDYATAVSEHTEALRLDPKNAHALRDLGWAYYAQGDLEACGPVWKRYATEYPGRTQPLNLLAQLHLRRKDAAAAVPVLRASLQIDPKQPDQDLKLAKALFWSDQFAEATSRAEALARAHPDDLATQIFWGELLMQHHDFVRGEAQWRKLLDMGLRSPAAMAYWVKSLHELGQYDEALAEARRFLDEAGPQQPLLTFLAQEAILRGRHEEAVHWYRLLAQHFPERLEVWLELARLQQEGGSLEESRRSLETARQAHSERLDLVVALAQVDRRLGRTQEAYGAFRSLRQSHPHHREIFVGRLETALEANRPEEALEVLMSRDPAFLSRSETALEASRILFAMGRESRARDALSVLVRPRSGTVHVPALLYHGLGEHARSASIPAALFESHLQALKERGYTAITAAELARMVDGKEPFPRHPILITFDDARRDSFEQADPLLARYGMKATMFVPTGLTLDDHPFFADWKTIAKYGATGRWDLQSHGHHAHDLVVVDAAESKGGFLVNRVWLAEEERLESFEEYQTRLDGDYGTSRKEIESRRKDATVVAYAFPFSEAGQESVGNEPRAADTNRQLLDRHFRFGFIQDSSGYNELRTSVAPLLLRRLSVPRDWDGPALVRHLVGHHPPTVALAQQARLDYWTAHYDRSREAWERLAREPSLAAEASYYLAGISHQRGLHDAARRHLRTARHLQAEHLRSDQALPSRIEWQGRSRLQTRADYRGDSDDRSSLSEGVDLRLGFLGPLDLAFGVGTLRLREEDVGSLSLRELSARAQIALLDQVKMEGRAWQRVDPGGRADSFGFGGRLAFQSDYVDLALRGGREDVETLRGRLARLQQDVYGAGATLRLPTRWLLAVEGTLGRLDDRNERRDGSARLVFAPRGTPGLRFGAAAGFSDTLFQSRLYYTPEELLWARGLVSYGREWGAGWRLDGEAGYGLASDDRHGRRRTVSAAGRAGQAWGERLRSFLEARYSDSPGYRSWRLGGGVELGF